MKPYFISASGYAEHKKLLARAEGGSLLDLFVNPRSELVIDEEEIAIINIKGVLGKSLTGIDKLVGMQDYDQLAAEIKEAGEKARAILLIIDSPGGQVLGCYEVANLIKQVKADIPVVAFTETVMASAAYYLGSSADFIIATHSAAVGSVGVLLPHINESRLWELSGISWEPILPEGAIYKDAGHGPDFTEEQKEFLRSEIQALAGEFYSFVSDHRLVDDEIYKAGTYHGQKALDLGLTDRIGGYFEAYKQVLKLAKANDKLRS